MSSAKPAHILKNTVLLRRSIVSICLAVALFFFAQEAWCKSSSARSKKNKTSVTAQAVYAVDLANNKVLFSRNARLRFQPASTVKLLTALVVLEHLKLEDEIVVSARAAGVEPTKAGLRAGVAYSAKDLLEALLATSANDAGIALAEAVSGTEAKFSALMNKKARSIGCRNSNFTNATGLPNKYQRTTAYDLSLITKAAFGDTFIRSTMKKKAVSIKGSDGRLITRNNHNKLLWRLKNPSVLGKTGYTKSAGHCYAGVAYYKGRNVSVVIMKSRKPWADIYAILGVRPKKG
ncbi:MAG TPA: hypothetical protein DCL35_02140 [Candidatus Omnitrophica bacterium]|nr:hypothetical protein [Candidatus Omnitrophota bacterium]